MICIETPANGAWPMVVQVNGGSIRLTKKAARTVAHAITAALSTPHRKFCLTSAARAGVPILQMPDGSLGLKATGTTKSAHAKPRQGQQLHRRGHGAEAETVNPSSKATTQSQRKGI